MPTKSIFLSQNILQQQSSSLRTYLLITTVLGVLTGVCGWTTTGGGGTGAWTGVGTGTGTGTGTGVGTTAGCGGRTTGGPTGGPIGTATTGLGGGGIGAIFCIIGTGWGCGLIWYIGWGCAYAWGGYTNGCGPTGIIIGCMG